MNAAAKTSCASHGYSAERAEEHIVVIDGVRRAGDIELFRSMPGFHLIAVDADIRTRYERAKLRAEKPEEATQTFNDFAALEQRSTEVTCRELIGQAEITFDNNGTMEDLHGKIDEYLQALGV